MAPTDPPRSYAAALAAFLADRDGTEYDPSTGFSQETLLSITPEQIQAYFNKKAYGTPTPTADMKPTLARANTLMDIKKKMSRFMVYKDMPWHPITRQGNPTKSPKVNDLIKSIKKAEVRHEGKVAQATRPFTLSEFLSVLDLVATVRGEDAVARYRAISTLQWQLIAWITCVQHLTVESIVLQPGLPGVLFANIRWSKNVHEERDSPTQCLFASMDPRLCCNIAFASHAKYFFSGHATTTPSTPIFGYGKPSDDSWAQTVLRKIIASENFVPDSRVSGILGTHGIRKGASTYIAKKGISREYVKLRGRWAMRTGVVDKYVGIDLPVPDAKAAFALAGPNGPCRYAVKDEVATEVTEEFLLAVVVPNIARVFGKEIALVLSRALLFAVFECPERVPSSIVEQIRTEMDRRQISSSVNPIRRVSFVVVQEDDQ